MNRDLLSSVIERWRSASMSHRMSDDEFTDYADAPALQPAPAPAAPVPGAAVAARRGLALQPVEEAARPRQLRNAPGTPGYPSRFR